MSDIDAFKNSESAAFRKLNPHIFGSNPVDNAEMSAKITEAFEVAQKQSAKKKRIRQSSSPEMNKLENEYFLYLKTLLPDAIVFPQSIRFRLGNGIWYKPDLIVSPPGGALEVFEVKGPHAFRGGFENLKVAAGIYKYIRFFLAWKEDGKWIEQHVLP